MDLDKQKTEENLIREQLANFQKLVKSPELIDDILSYKEEINPAKEFQTDKLIDCPHEIIFTITAQALSQNEKGEIVGTKEICVKNYHIPVPIDKDYNHYMSVFFDHLEKKIIESIDDSNQEAKDHEAFQNE